MKKKLFKLVNIALSLVSVFSVAGCRNNQGGSTVNNSVNDPSKNVYKYGTHSFVIKETNEKLLDNGATNYKVLLPRSASATELLAANELVSLFYEATGINLHIYNETDNIKASDGKFISIGKTKLREAHNEKFDAKILGADGIRILTIDDDVFLSGAGDNGTLYSVHEFLRQIVGYEYVCADTYLLDEAVRTIPLMEYDIVDVPDVVRRISSTGYCDANVSMLRGLRLSSASNSMFPTGVLGGGVHNSLKFFSNETDSDYFGANGAQLCYSGHGKSEKLDAMIKIVGNQMIESLKTYPELCDLSITQEDNSAWCKCGACSSDSEKYGTDAAVLIKFVNKLKAYIDAWMETEEGLSYKRDITILFFAYNSTTNAPVYWDERKQAYVAIDADVKCAEGVGVFYAPISADFTKSFYHEDNKVYYENMLAWSSLTDTMWLWIYGTNFKHYLYPYNTFHAQQETLQFSMESGAKMIYTQRPHNDTGAPTGWGTLQQYLDAKWMWNVNYTYSELLDIFFEAYFGVAKETMLKFFDECDQHTFNLIQAGTEANYSGMGSIYKDIDKESLFPKQLVRKWLNYCNTALEEIEYLKESNAKDYNNIRTHIISERLFPLFMLCDVYGNGYSVDDLSSMRMQFKTDAAQLGRSRSQEGRTLLQDYQKWGID